MRRQKGVTLSGFLMWSVVAVFAALLLFKIGPPYMEFLTIQANLKAVANDPEGRSGVSTTCCRMSCWSSALPARHSR